MRLILPVIYRKTESEYKIDADLPLSADDFVVNNVIFYKIDVIEPVKNSPNECIVTVSGADYRVALSMKEVDKKIMKQKLHYGSN